MKQDTKDFLATVLWLADNPDDLHRRFAEKSVYDFAPEIIDLAEAFVDGFRAHLERTGFDMDLLRLAGRSFGGNVYFSLSGHGAGFFDDSRHEIQELHEAIAAWAGELRFFELVENLEVRGDGVIDFAILPEFIEDYRRRVFAVPETEAPRETDNG